jgi:hypothetical protein
MADNGASPVERSYSDRVRYASKALLRRRLGDRFDLCFAQADSQHVAAVLMLRAEKNPDLKRAIMAAFGVTRWADVPWSGARKRFRGMSSHAIGADAQRALADAERMMGAGLLTGPDV